MTSRISFSEGNHQYRLNGYRYPIPSVSALVSSLHRFDNDDGNRPPPLAEQRLHDLQIIVGQRRGEGGVGRGHARAVRDAERREPGAGAGQQPV